jgi:hypothetical protein
MRTNAKWRIHPVDLERWIQGRYQGREVSIDFNARELVFHAP